MNCASGGSAAGFKLLQISAEVLKDMRADVGGCGTKLLPVFLLSDQSGAFGLDDVDGVGDVVAQLRVAQDI
jgi:hypothetical protein